MSTGPRTQASFVQGNQSSAEHDACHSALLYLFQEVSKLASPIHSSFLDADQPSTWRHDASRPLMVTNEESEGARHSSDSSSLSCNQVIKVKEESHSSEVTTSVEPHPKCSSPWKVLSLINLQCERLLNQDVDESDSISELSCTKLSADKASTADPVDDQSRCYKPRCCRKDSCCVKNSDTESRQFEINQECQRESLSPERVSFPSETQSLHASLNAQLTFNSDADPSVALSKPALTLDHNANFALTPEPTGDAVLPSSQPARLLFPETCQPQKHPPLNSSSLKPSATPEPEPGPRPVQREDPAAPSTQQWRTKTPRKQPYPRRSADIQDPDFQGVTFRMDTELDDDREQCRLLITSKYSMELRKSARKPRLRTRTSQKSLKTSSSDEDGDITTSMSTEGKVCASCCTRKTPMWRDAEDGTPLCNACGIRYKKYRVRCVSCWHIPKKEGNYNSRCLKCGNFVRLTSAQRKHSP